MSPPSCPPTPLGHHRALSSGPCAAQKLDMDFTHGSLHLSKIIHDFLIYLRGAKVCLRWLCIDMDKNVLIEISCKISKPQRVNCDRTLTSSVA